MARIVRDFIEIKDCSSIDALIAELTSIRASLPPLSEAEVKMGGDDVRGRVMTIGFWRSQTPEEGECEARYADAYRQAREWLEAGFVEALDFTAVRPVLAQFPGAGRRADASFTRLRPSGSAANRR